MKLAPETKDSQEESPIVTRLRRARAVGGASLSGPQKAVLLILAMHADDDGVCWPGVDTIADETCLSENTVRAASAHLVKLGVVSRVARPQTSHLYRFDDVKLEQMAQESLAARKQRRALMLRRPSAGREGAAREGAAREGAAREGAAGGVFALQPLRVRPAAAEPEETKEEIRGETKGDARAPAGDSRRDRAEPSVAAPQSSVRMPLEAPSQSAPARRVNTGGAVFEEIRAAFVEGITSVTNGPYVLDVFAYRDLSAVVNAHAPKGTALELVAWVRTKAAEFAAVAIETGRFTGLKPRAFGDWLNEPRIVTAKRRPGVVRQGLKDGVDARAANALETESGDEILAALSLK